jgi:molybdenum cofactor cytidylyltransferase
MSRGRVGALVLAAGLGSRMGASKLTLPLYGRPVLAHTLAAVAGAGLPALVVTGAHRAAVAAAAGSHPTVHAADHANGLSASLRAGLGAAPDDWASVLILLGDMPFVRPETLCTLASRLDAGEGVVVPVHAGARGNPVGFARAHWPALLALEGDRGARALLDRLGAVDVAVDDPGVLRDLDRPEDLQAVSAAPWP